jgi:hypothetical protein
MGGNKCEAIVHTALVTSNEQSVLLFTSFPWS